MSQVVIAKFDHSRLGGFLLWVLIRILCRELRGWSGKLFSDHAGDLGADFGGVAGATTALPAAVTLAVGLAIFLGSGYWASAHFIHFASSSFFLRTVSRAAMARSASVSSSSSSSESSSSQMWESSGVLAASRGSRMTSLVSGVKVVMRRLVLAVCRA